MNNVMIRHRFYFFIQLGRGRDLGVEERVDELQAKVRELEKQNTTLKSKVRNYTASLFMTKILKDSYIEIDTDNRNRHRHSVNLQEII